MVILLGYESWQHETQILYRWFMKLLKVFILLICSMLSACTSISPPANRQFADGKQVFLLEDLRYNILNTNYEILVPAGFVTDYASIPRFLWPIYSPNDVYFKAAIVHDYLYWSKPCGKDDESKYQSDMILRIAMYEDKVNPLTREIVYRSVRLFGGGAWKDNSIERKNSQPRFVPKEALKDYNKAIGPLVTWEKYRVQLVSMNEPLDSETESPPSYCSAIEQLWYGAD
jgi:hypothetical protein